MKDLVKRLSPYAKSVVAVLGILILIANAVVDGVFTQDELIAILTAIGVAIGVYQVPNSGA